MAGVCYTLLVDAPSLLIDQRGPGGFNLRGIGILGSVLRLGPVFAQHTSTPPSLTVWLVWDSVGDIGNSSLLTALGKMEDWFGEVADLEEVTREELASRQEELAEHTVILLTRSIDQQFEGSTTWVVLRDSPEAVWDPEVRLREQLDIPVPRTTDPASRAGTVVHTEHPSVSGLLLAALLDSSVEVQALENPNDQTYVVYAESSDSVDSLRDGGGEVWSWESQRQNLYFVTASGSDAPLDGNAIGHAGDIWLCDTKEPPPQARAWLNSSD